MTQGERRPIPSSPDALPSLVIRVLDVVAVAYVGVLVYATHHPAPQKLLGPTPPSDTLLHLMAYTALGGLVAAAMAARGGWSVRSGVAIFVPLALFAALDEVTQPLFGRWAERLDWAFDGIGLIIGIAAVTALAVWRQRTRATPPDGGRSR
jgi:VanZ family protein